MILKSNTIGSELLDLTIKHIFYLKYHINNESAKCFKENCLQNVKLINNKKFIYLSIDENLYKICSQMKYMTIIFLQKNFGFYFILPDFIEIYHNLMLIINCKLTEVDEISHEFSKSFQYLTDSIRNLFNIFKYCSDLQFPYDQNYSTLESPKRLPKTMKLKSITKFFQNKDLPILLENFSLIFSFFKNFCSANKSQGFTMNSMFETKFITKLYVSFMLLNLCQIGDLDPCIQDLLDKIYEKIPSDFQASFPLKKLKVLFSGSDISLDTANEFPVSDSQESPKPPNNHQTKTTSQTLTKNSIFNINLFDTDYFLFGLNLVDRFIAKGENCKDLLKNKYFRITRNPLSFKNSYQGVKFNDSFVQDPNIKNYNKNSENTYFYDKKDCSIFEIGEDFIKKRNKYGDHTVFFDNCE